jgi:negative regulator of flagellin synthesis FlgM
MTGISDLSTLFGNSTRTAETSSEGLSVGSTGSNGGASIGSDQSLLSSDKSVVSSAGGAMLQAMNSSDVRADKVASLQAAIANGTYNVSSQDVAQKLIASMLGGG